MTKMLTVAMAIGVAGSAAMAGEITKPPDQGPFWQPLGPTVTTVYANSFVADETGPVSELGTWLLGISGPGTGANIAFEVWGSVGGNAANGPDAGNVIASTGFMDIGGGTATLDLYTAAADFSGDLTDGETYWFAATTVGQEGDGTYQVGGHTQNSVYNDNGTFWFSNDPNGVDFDGQGLTPEMAFTVTIVPAPGAAALLGLGGLAMVRRRR